MSDKQEIAGILLDLKAVSVSPRKPFTWASGLKSPLYCDNRLIISTVEERRVVVNAFLNLMEEKGWKPDVVAGTATAGIPHAAWIAERLSVPMIYVRSSEKKHGRKNLIEGSLPPGAEVVVIEDLISTGGSSVKAAIGVQEAGGKVLGVAAIFQYGMEKARACFEEAGLPFATLTDLESLLDVAGDKGLLSEEEKTLVSQWRQDPPAWSETYG